MYLRRNLVRVMCQRFQKSPMETALYGELKFCGRSRFIIRAMPAAISQYPEKSKYNWRVKAREQNQASTMDRPESTVNPYCTPKVNIGSISNTLERPTVNQIIPLLKFS